MTSLSHASTCECRECRGGGGFNNPFDYDDDTTNQIRRDLAATQAGRDLLASCGRPSTDDLLGAWPGPETTDELMAAIRPGYDATAGHPVKLPRWRAGVWRAAMWLESRASYLADWAHEVKP